MAAAAGRARAGGRRDAEVSAPDAVPAARWPAGHVPGREEAEAGRRPRGGVGGGRAPRGGPAPRRVAPTPAPRPGWGTRDRVRAGEWASRGGCPGHLGRRRSGPRSRAPVPPRLWPRWARGEGGASARRPLAGGPGGLRGPATCRLGVCGSLEGPRSSPHRASASRGGGGPGNPVRLRGRLRPGRASLPACPRCAIGGPGSHPGLARSSV